MDISMEESIAKLTEDEALHVLAILVLMKISDDTRIQWKEFTDEIKTNNRFFPRAKLLETLAQVKDDSTIELHPGDTFFRSRIIKPESIWDINPNEKKRFGEIMAKWNPELKEKDTSEIFELLDSSDPSFHFPPSVIDEVKQLLKTHKLFWGYNAKNSDAPPSSLAPAGRANSKNISYLYLCDDIKTSILEVNPRIKQMVSVATIRVSETLKLFDMCKPEGQNSKRGLTLDFGILSAEFSKPNWGNEDDYWPTQYLCEYIKHLGFDGIRFCSSINPESKNIVIFDTNENPVTKQKRYRIIGSQVFVVSSLNLETQQIAPFKEKS